MKDDTAIRWNGLLLLIIATVATILLPASAILSPAQTGSVISAHDTGIPFIFVGSTADGGGALAIEHGFAVPIEVTESARLGGFVLYTGIDPSFEPPENEDGDLFFLDDGTKVTVEITGRGPNAGMKLNGVQLSEVGDSVLLGAAPALHAHPEWQLTLPEGATGCQPISFRLTTDSPKYRASESYTAYLTNDETTCVIPTPTPGGPPGCGDPDGSGAVTVSDGVNVLRAAAGLGSTCANAGACDVDGSGAVTVTDGVNVLRAAAGLSADLTCPDL